MVLVRALFFSPNPLQSSVLVNLENGKGANMTEVEELRLQQLIQKQKNVALNSLELRELLRLSEKKRLKEKTPPLESGEGAVFVATVQINQGGAALANARRYGNFGTFCTAKPNFA